MFDRVRTNKVSPGQWIRVPFNGAHTARVTLQLRSSSVDTKPVAAFIDGPDAMIRCPEVPYGRYKVVASDGHGNSEVGFVLISREA